MEIIGCLVIPFVGLLSLASTVFWIWMLVECATKEKTEGNSQMLWIGE